MIRALLLLSLLAHLTQCRSLPQARPNIAGQEIDGVFPQVGSGAADLSVNEVGRALRSAMDAADVDMSGGLTFKELQPVFRRVRARGDPVWTVLDAEKFGRVLFACYLQLPPLPSQCYCCFHKLAHDDLRSSSATPTLLPARRTAGAAQLAWQSTTTIPRMR